MTAGLAPTAPLVISGWSVISPYGIGVTRFAEGLRSGRSALTAPAGPDWPAPGRAVGRVPDFDARTVLGRKGTRAMDRPTTLAVAAAGRVLAAAGPELLGPDRDGTGVGLVLGTSNGSVQSMMDFTRDSYTGARPYLVDPARFPNTVMNRAAGQSAIWHGLRGPNTTVAAGLATMLAAFAYTLRLIRSGHAEVALCGAVEELSPQRLRLHRSTATEPDRALGEACALYLVEPAGRAAAGGRAAVAEPVAVELGVHGPDATPERVLQRCLWRAIRRVRLQPEQLWAVATGPRPAAQEAALRLVLPPGRPRRLQVDRLTGDTGAASGGLSLAGLLVTAATDPAAAGKYALLTSVDPDGVAGCGLFRLQPGDHPGNHADDRPGDPMKPTVPNPQEEPDA